MDIGFKFILIVLMLLSFISGAILPLGIGLLFITCGVALAISLFQFSRTGKPTFIKFFLLPVIMAGVAGFLFDDYKTKQTKSDILAIAKLTDDYYAKHQHYPSDDNPIFNGFDKVSIDSQKAGEYTIDYHDAHYDSVEKEIYLRPRP